MCCSIVLAQGITTRITEILSFITKSGEMLTSSCFSRYVSVSRVKSGKLGRSAKFGQRPCLFHILIIVIKIY